uniref:Uncharacterized protein n=1 Tax=Oryza glumipatula TaxID=40148 RepID=A0A0D9YMC8_9ORYZ
MTMTWAIGLGRDGGTDVSWQTLQHVGTYTAGASQTMMYNLTERKENVGLMTQGIFENIS